MGERRGKEKKEGKKIFSVLENTFNCYMAGLSDLLSSQLAQSASQTNMQM